MGRLTFYRFRSVWTLDAAPDDVFDALEDLEQYPAWWREVKEVSRLDADTHRLRCRSSLPYDLVFSSTLAVKDPDRGVLESRLEGDLEGFSRWTITPRGGGSEVVFEEEVVTNKRSLNLLAPVARLAFVANHTLMMRHGREGLRKFVAGFVHARRLANNPR